MVATKPPLPWLDRRCAFLRHQRICHPQKPLTREELYVARFFKAAILENLSSLFYISRGLFRREGCSVTFCGFSASSIDAAKSHGPNILWRDQWRILERRCRVSAIRSLSCFNFVSPIHPHASTQRCGGYYLAVDRLYFCRLAAE